MRTRFLWAILPLFLAGEWVTQPARADTYMWVDASGRFNIGNVEPPEDAHVTKVVHETAPKATAREDAAREAARQAEVQALAAQVRQLEEELERTKQRQATPPVEYRTMPAPPVAQYVTELVLPPVQYPTAAVAPPVSTGCDYAWRNCGFGWAPVVYPATVVVLSVPSFRHFHSRLGNRPFAVNVKPPVRVAGPSRHMQ